MKYSVVLFEKGKVIGDEMTRRKTLASARRAAWALLENNQGGLVQICCDGLMEELTLDDKTIGRRPKDPEAMARRVSFTLYDDHVEKLQSLADRYTGGNTSKMIRRLITKG